MQEMTDAVANATVADASKNRVQSRQSLYMKRLSAMDSHEKPRRKPVFADEKGLKRSENIEL
jgi:hypothetical protein